jgi:hypothetical protein
MFAGLPTGLPTKDDEKLTIDAIESIAPPAMAARDALKASGWTNDGYRRLA